MKPDEIKLLLGGYATGTLTPEQQEALFGAALRDQDLFDELMREQALKDALGDATLRRELIAELQPKPTWRERLSAWTQRPMALAGAAAVVLTVVGVVAVIQFERRSSEGTVQVAEVRPPARQSVEHPPAAPAPAPAKPQGRAMREFKLPQMKDRSAVEPVLEPDASPPALPASPSQYALPPAPPAAVAEVPPVRKAEAKAVHDQAAKSTKFAESQARPAGRIESDEVRREAHVSSAPRAAPASGVVGGVIGGVPGGIGGGVASNAVPARVVQPLSLTYTTGRSGAGVEIAIDPNADSVAYLFRRAASGEWVSVTPGGISLKARTRATTPAFVPEPGAAQPRAMIVLSRAPLAQLAQSGAELTAAVEQLRTTVARRRPPDLAVVPVVIE